MCHSTRQHGAMLVLPVPRSLLQVSVHQPFTRQSQQQPMEKGMTDGQRTDRPVIHVLLAPRLRADSRVLSVSLLLRWTNQSLKSKQHPTAQIPAALDH